MKNVTKKVVAQALVLWVGLAGALPSSYGDEVNVPGPTAVNAELRQDAVSVDALQQGQAQDQAQLQQMTALQAAVADFQTRDNQPTRRRTPDGKKEVYLTDFDGTSNVSGSTYLAIYDVASKTTRYQRVPEKGYAYYGGQEIEAVSNRYALVSFTDKLYVIDLQDSSVPMRSASTSWAGSAYVNLKAAFFLKGDDNTAAVEAGGQLRFLNASTAQWVSGPRGATMTPDGNRLAYFAGSTPEDTRLAVFNFRYGTTLYSQNIPPERVAGLKMEAVGQQVALVSSQGTLYKFDLLHLDQDPKSVAVPGVPSSGMYAAILNGTTAAVISGDVYKKAYVLNLTDMTLTETRASQGVATPQGDKVISVTARLVSVNGQVQPKFLLAVRDVKTGAVVYKEFYSVSPLAKLTDLTQFQIDAVSKDGETALVYGLDETAYVFSTRDSSTLSKWRVSIPGYKPSSWAAFLSNGNVQIHTSAGVYELDPRTGKVVKIQ